MQRAERIDKAVFDILVHPGAFNRQKAAHVLVFLGASDVYFLVAGVVVTDGHHMLAVRKPLLGIFEERIVKAEFVVQTVIALAAVREIDAVEHPVREHKLEHAAFFIEFLDVKAVIDRVGFNLGVDSYTTVTFLALARIPVSVVALAAYDFGNLVLFGADFLKAQHIRIGRGEPVIKAFFQYGTNTIDVPAVDFHLNPNHFFNAKDRIFFQSPKGKCVYTLYLVNKFLQNTFKDRKKHVFFHKFKKKIVLLYNNLIFTNMKKKILLPICVLAISTLVGCGGSSQKGDELEIPTDLPPICRDIDFNADPDMREVCGVRKASSHNIAYRNIPQQRYLIKPSETSIVKTNGKLELRFQNSLPINLEGPITNELEFSQEKRLERVKNTYDYHEITRKGYERLRIFKMGIPTDRGNKYDFCFRIPEKKGNDRTRSKAMGVNIEMMSCSDFDNIVSAK